MGEAKRRFPWEDLASGAVLLAVALLLLVQTLEMPAEASLYPQFVLGALAAASAALIIRGLILRGGLVAEGPGLTREQLLRSAAMVAALVFYVILLPVLGYIVNTLWLVPAACLILGYRHVIPIAVATLIMAAGAYFVFSTIFRVPLPGGVLVS